MVKLIKNKNETWSIFGEDKAFEHFSSIETASHFLMYYFKVKDDDIDDALIEMCSFNKSTALFSKDGDFVTAVD